MTDAPAPPAPAAPLERPSSFRVALRALRAVSFTASIVPVALGAVLAIGWPDTRWSYLPLVFLGALLIQAGTNVINDVVDFRKGVDSPANFGHSGVFVNGWMSTRAGHLYAIGLFGAAALVGVALTLLRGWPVLVIGAVGLLGGYLYTGGPKGYKYLALGDVAVFILMGPLMVVGAHYVLTGDFAPARVVWASLPVGFLVAAILECNNLRDIETDRQAGVRTVAQILGFRGAKVEFAVSVAAAYVIVVALAVTRMISWGSLLVLVTLPMAIPLLRVVMTAPKPGSRRLAIAMGKTAMLHMAFGAALVAGLGLAAAV